MQGLSASNYTTGVEQMINKKRRKDRKKGIIFALDGAVAVTIVLLMIINTTYYFTTTSKESLSQTQIVRRGYDALAMFNQPQSDGFSDLEWTLSNIQTGDTEISDNGRVDTPAGYGLNISHYIPKGYDMLIELFDAKKTPCPGGSCSVQLNTGGDFYVQVNTGSAASNLLVNGFHVIGHETGCSGCTYTTTVPIKNFVAGQSKDIIISGDDVNWVRVLDSPDYVLTTSKSEHAVPKNRFIGSGERWFAAKDINGHFEGFHRVRFKIWLV